jgi:hypothetical protein
MRRFESFSEIIDAIGIGTLATVFGVPESHVRTMKVRKSIPFDRWPELVKAARDRGFDLDEGTLRGLRARRFEVAAEKALAS